MIKSKCTLLFLLLFPLFGQGQELFSEPESKFLARISFRMYSGGVIIVRAKIDGVKDSLNFILDTGSGGISLDSSTCVEFNIPTQKTDTTIKGMGGIRKVSFVFGKDLHLPGLTVRDLNFHINNYEVLSSVYGDKIDGIIGYSFFSRYVVKINFDDLFLDIFTPGEVEYPRGGTILHPVLTSLPIQYLQVKDARRLGYNFYFDTGAGLCFLMSEQFAKDSAILLSKRKPKVTQAEGMGGRLQMRITIVREVKIGPYRFHQVPTYLYQDHHNVTSYPYSGGLIGNELLRRFNMVINYPKREIHLAPNTHYNDLFDYSYSGLGIYYIDNKITVVDVIPGSPAAKGGFLPDDEIYGVANNLSHNIQQYKNIIQTPHQRIKIIVKRANKLIQLYLNTETIL